MNDERIDELLALAALGELTEAEEAELDIALEADALLAGELDADQAAAAFLQQGLAEPPPAELRASVLDAIANVPQESLGATNDVLPVAPPVEAPQTAALPVEAPAPVENNEVVSLDAARRRRSVWQPLVAAAAVIGLVVVGASVVNRGDDAPTFAEVTQSSDASTRTLDGPLDGELRVAFSASEDVFVLDGVAVAGVADDETYQLWLVDESGATSVGTFQPDDSGRVIETYEGIDPSGFTVGVTVEPAGGSVSPTLPIVASA